jgi:hypothetical protein
LICAALVFLCQPLYLDRDSFWGAAPFGCKGADLFLGDGAASSQLRRDPLVLICAALVFLCRPLYLDRDSFWVPQLRFERPRREQRSRLKTRSRDAKKSARIFAFFELLLGAAPFDCKGAAFFLG